MTLDWTWLTRITNDMAPDSGPQAAARLLGPWSEVLRPAVPAHRWALAAAQARWGFLVEDGRPLAPIDEYLAERPVRQDPARLQILAWLRQPPGAWRLRELREDGTWIVEDLCGFEAWRQPRTVRLDRPGSVWGAPAPGSLLLARMAADTLVTSRRAPRPEDAPQSIALTPLVLPDRVAPYAAAWFAGKLAHERTAHAPWCSAEALAFRHGEALVGALHRLAWRLAHDLPVPTPDAPPVPPATERPLKRRARQQLTG